MPVTSHTVVLTPDQAEKLRAILERDHFEFIEKPYTLFAGKKGKLNVSVYQKGPKVLVQGKETEDFVKFTLEPEVIGEARLGYEEVHQPDMFEPHFGIDESGKGDFFGPLVIAGVYTDASIARALMELGIMDSKRISSAKRIRELSAKIRSVPGIASSIVAIGPERYNELFPKFRNLNRMLAWGHARVIANLARERPDCPRTLSDQFAQPELLARALKKEHVTIELEQRTKGESDIAVAAASILARERFVDWIDKTSAAGGVILPLGASDAVIEAGKQVIERHGPAALGKVGKLHFRTSSRILGHPDPDGTESA
ncbi:ribonuclease HIII [Haloferula chungangensis]|uniref:Ribonuclease n=1 Tax=Haloferula chungangensis TaxID=1048331 RepID=A0ABW2L9Z0_9BACT